LGACLDHGSVDDTAIIWDVKQGTPSARLKGHTGDVNAANGSAVITASDDDTIKLWRASDGAFRYADRPYDKVVTLAVSLSDGALASGALDGTIKI